MLTTHDVPVGPLKRCQISGSENLFQAIDLGHQPPCDALLDHLDQPEKTYPLRLNICPESGLAQLDYIVAGEEIYPPTYPYRSGISKPLEEYQRAFADGVVRRFGKGLTVDIGSNDGTLLTGFKRNGCEVLGIEPTNVALIAIEENGIPTCQTFFTKQIAQDVAKSFGKAKFVTMTNVFAHMASLGEVMRGIRKLLADDGVFITESHYLLDVLEKTQFDTVYHEHIRTYSLKSIRNLVAQYGMEVFDVERKDRYGGNIRAYIGWKGKRTVTHEVWGLLQEEERKGLFTPERWKAWEQRAKNCRDQLQEFLLLSRRAGKTVAGVSAPGRCAVLLNYAGVNRDDIPYLGELHNSLKLGKYLPGSHIPIVHNERIPREQPDAVILMAWHYADPIIKRLRGEGYKGEIYAPIPRFECVSAS